MSQLKLPTSYRLLADKPEGPRMRLLRDYTDGIHPPFEKMFNIVGEPTSRLDRPGCECPFCAKREAQGLPPRIRYDIPIVDLADNQAKMLSVTEVGMRSLRELMAEFLRGEETARLIKAQRERAEAFKFSKMIYGAKR